MGLGAVGDEEPVEALSSTQHTLATKSCASTEFGEVMPAFFRAFLKLPSLGTGQGLIVFVRSAALLQLSMREASIRIPPIPASQSPSAEWNGNMRRQ